MSARVHALEAEGMLAPGQRHEDVVIIRGRKPARAGTARASAAVPTPAT
jgi:hypothetical protein